MKGAGFAKAHAGDQTLNENDHHETCFSGDFVLHVGGVNHPRINAILSNRSETVHVNFT